MNRRLRRLSPRTLSPAEQRFLRYLKPGALAQLRDSKINARSHLRSTDSSSSSQFQFHQIPLSPPSPSQIDAYPFSLSPRIHGPRFLQRKRLGASRPVFFNPSSSPASNPPDSVIDLFGSSNDMLVAH